jgi:hypothetical protein
MLKLINNQPNKNNSKNNNKYCNHKNNHNLIIPKPINLHLLILISLANNTMSQSNNKKTKIFQSFNLYINPKNNKRRFRNNSKTTKITIIWMIAHLQIWINHLHLSQTLIPNIVITIQNIPHSYSQIYKVSDQWQILKMHGYKVHSHKSQQKQIHNIQLLIKTKTIIQMFV